MKNKTYEQMEADFKEFYSKKIKPRLVEYEKERKEGVPKIIAFKVCWFSFILSFALVFFSNIIPIKLQPITMPISFISLGIAICSMVWLILLTRNDSKDNRGSVTIKSNFEYNLKLALMRYFLDIFSQNTDWHKGLRCGYWEKIDNYRKTNIFNPFPYALFDDTIYLVYKNIEINIYETNTAIFNNCTVMLIPFCLIFFGCFIKPIIISFFFFRFIIYIFIPAFIIAIFFIIKKCIQYSPFKGVVVELKMNKNFKGHTFFLNKSFQEKKIAINCKKYENIKLESIDFMSKYKVYSTDQIEARYILTTAMIDRLEHLQLAFRANYIRGSFKDNKLILAIDTGKDMFAMGNDFKKSNFQTFRDLFNEIISIMKIIDQLKLDEKTGL